MLGLAIAGGQRCARLEITVKQHELLEIKNKVMTAVKPHLISMNREFTTGGGKLEAEALKTRRGRAWLYYRHLLARDGEMGNQSSLARSVKIIDGAMPIADDHAMVSSDQEMICTDQRVEEQDDNLRAPLRRPEFEPELTPEEVAAWHLRSFLNKPIRRTVFASELHPDADKLKKWLGTKSLSIELEPTRPDLPSGIATYRIRDRKMIELIQARLMVDLEKYCEEGQGWESMPNLQPGEEALRRTRSAGRLSMRYLYRVLFDTVLEALDAGGPNVHTFALLATLLHCSAQAGHGDDPMPDRYSAIFAIHARSISFALDKFKASQRDL